MAEIVAFYSYKGGVGRSLLLANVATMLAQKGRKVACFDLDVEAGGLHTIFKISRNKIRASILDLLTLPFPPTAEQALIDITDECVPGAKGKLYLLPTVTEKQKLMKLKEVESEVPAKVKSYLSQVVDAVNPNYVLLDSRSGFADLGTSAAIAQADKVVCVLRPNRQNVEGLSLFLDVIKNLNPPLPYFLVLTQTPGDRPDVRETVKKLESQLGKNRHFDAEVPYTTKLALEENILAKTAPESEEAEKYRPVVDWLERRPW